MIKRVLIKTIVPLLFLFALRPSNLGAATAVGYHGKLSVNGNKIVNESGDPVSLAGNSFFWSNTSWGAEPFYNEEMVNYLQEEWNATIIRGAMGVDETGGYLSDSLGNKERIKTLVAAAVKQGVYVIIDWHSHNAEDNTQEAVNFFQEMATLYGHLPNVIYEPYNEPDRSPTASTWTGDIKPYHETVVAAIREIDPDNLIILGTPTWSQDVDIAANNPLTGYENLVYTLHFYAGTHGQSLRNKATAALNSGIAIMVTEWGTVSASGDGAVAEANTEAWMKFLKDNQISHMNWSVHNKNEGASVFKPATSATGGWTDDDLTESGLFVKNIVSNWDSINYDGDDSFDNWLLEEGYPENQDPLSDPDKNGLTLLMEYALGIESSRKLSRESLSIDIKSASQISLQFMALRTDILYSVSKSSNMVVWEEISSVTGNGETVSLQLTAPENGLLYRLKIKRK